jgi:SsrA-binding protein
MSKIIASNKAARRDYEIIETLEAGIELRGSEVKAIRAGNINLNDSFARIEKGEIFLYNTHISPYAEASYLNVDPLRVRRLLLHKNQIRKLYSNLSQRGFTLIPLSIYFNESGIAKMELALCKGRRLFDRREAIKLREADLEMRRALKGRRK